MVEKKRPKQVFRPPKAADWNAMAAAADKLTRSGLNIDGGRGQRAPNPGPLMVKNNSGADQRRGDVLMLDGTALLTDISSEQPWLGADKITASSVGEAPVILLDPLIDGKVGPAVMSGVAACYVDIVSADHTHAWPDQGDDQLQSGYAGPLQIVYKPSGTGEKLCFVSFSPGPIKLYARHTSAISAATGGGTCDYVTPTSATVTLWEWDDANSRYKETTKTVTAYNKWLTEIPANRLFDLAPGPDWRLTIGPVDCTDCT